MSTLTGDPLAPLVQLPAIASAVGEAEAAIAQLRREPVVFRGSTPGGRDHEEQAVRLRAVRDEIALRSAHAALGLLGAQPDLATLRAGAQPHPLAQGCLRVSAQLPLLVSVWRTAPPQALAKLHLLAGAGSVVEPDLGRPNTPTIAEEVLLLMRAAQVPGAAPAIIRAAVIAAQLLNQEAFGQLTPVIAAAAARLTLAAAGTDPLALVLLEAGHLARQPEYVGALGAYATGRPDGVRSWLRHFCAAVTEGAQKTQALIAAGPGN